MGMAVGLQAASVFVGLQAARAQSKAYKMEAAAYEEEKKMAQLEGMQAEEARRQQLRQQLASLGTSMSSQGVALGTSPSVDALERDEMKTAKADISRIKLMGSANRRKYDISAAGSKAQAKATTLAGYSSAAAGAYNIS